MTKRTEVTLGRQFYKTMHAALLRSWKKVRTKKALLEVSFLGTQINDQVMGQKWIVCTQTLFLFSSNRVNF